MYPRGKNGCISLVFQNKIKPRSGSNWPQLTGRASSIRCQPCIVRDDPKTKAKYEAYVAQKGVTGPDPCGSLEGYQFLISMVLRDVIQIQFLPGAEREN